MTDDPLVSVIIPTYNAAETLAQCLQALQRQTYENIEIIIVDSYSTDETVTIAKRFGVKVIPTTWKLLGARYLGFLESRGELSLLLDSDQILEETALERSVSMIPNGYDLLCLEERSYQSDTWIQKLFEADRTLIHKCAAIHLDPFEGVLLARLYKRYILARAFRSIPAVLLPFVVAYDHAILYCEAYKISQKAGIVPNAVWHIEPRGVMELIRKNYRYGKSACELAASGYYKDLLASKVRFRKGALQEWNLGVQTYLLLSLKGVGFYLGYLARKTQK
jgi:glycosyltransferase involved in cell wall biosynthesis